MGRILITAWLMTAAFACKGRAHDDPFAAAARAAAPEAELSAPRPILTVRDLRASQAYYRDALGFKLDWEHGAPPDFGSVSRADAVVFLCQGCPGTPGAWMMIFARDVDRLHADLVDRHAQIRMPPTNMPWGIREMHVADLDGNVLRFGTGIE